MTIKQPPQAKENMHEALSLMKRSSAAGLINCAEFFTECRAAFELPYIHSTMVNVFLQIGLVDSETGFKSYALCKAIHQFRVLDNSPFVSLPAYIVTPTYTRRSP